MPGRPMQRLAQLNQDGQLDFYIDCTPTQWQRPTSPYNTPHLYTPLSANTRLTSNAADVQRHTQQAKCTHPTLCMCVARTGRGLYTPAMTSKGTTRLIPNRLLAYEGVPPDY
ncbi:hypothetical protein SARC_02651 [Sphaeroforma arctica JP610]|uniref:Uncharacterized protein n=1 Tax=Sphaeroforma arctica JP610 TaxID=667725 RepID=A0A0L0GA91_9EUKA|nr:hypothetical protein SARC_02651 [Sphaeroforma arctica JP610]KNC85158.1 hypothetical protein SARC_02651 [Sphaeroforma arctica JP610]|eukprot:XP_014159060.1 hypothetical protein SARC_02651 [Sphaeroforma arctica JP610]